MYAAAHSTLDAVPEPSQFGSDANFRMLGTDAPASKLPSDSRFLISTCLSLRAGNGRVDASCG